MSSPRDSSESSTPQLQSKPKQASRSVSLLTPEQLQRKRAQDRESQRQNRARVKRTIAELQERVEIVTEELQLTRLNNASLQNTNASLQETNASLQGMITSLKNASLQEKNELAIPGITPIGWDSGLLVDTKTESENQNFVPTLWHKTQVSRPVWEARPVNILACEFDEACVKYILSDVPWVDSFAYLHDLQQYLPKSLVTFADIGFPELVAVTYVKYAMIRWIITGSEVDYDAMPEWLRPGACQIATAHPLWIDTIPWPELRARVCRDMWLYQGLKDECDETMSINWPYEPQDILVTAGLNPIFIRHIQSIDNWTLGTKFLDKHPEFRSAVNIR